VPPGRTLRLENGWTNTQSWAVFGFGFGLGVGVGLGVGFGLLLGVGVGLALGDGLLLPAGLVLGVGLVLGFGVALGDELVVAGVALALDEAPEFGLALDATEAPGFVAMSDTTLAAAAGRLAQVLVVLTRWYRCASAMVAPQTPLETTKAPAMTLNVAVWARRKVIDAPFPRCRGARGCRSSPPWLITLCMPGRPIPPGPHSTPSHAPEAIPLGGKLPGRELCTRRRGGQHGASRHSDQASAAA
jgi:hypothetical protein